ncbi:MAG TPA: hypothetical protein VFV57_11850 [Limnobacter sp.]|nr:hypothetical protein [Limnobacter sp.]
MGSSIASYHSALSRSSIESLSGIETPGDQAETAPYWLKSTLVDRPDSSGQSRIIASSEGLKHPTPVGPANRTALQDFLDRCVKLHQSRDGAQQVPVVAQFISPLAFVNPEKSKDVCLSHLLNRAREQSGSLAPGVEVRSVSAPRVGPATADTSLPRFRDFDVQICIDGVEIKIQLREIAPDFRDGFMTEASMLGMLPLLKNLSPCALVSRFGLGRTAIAHVLLAAQAKVHANPTELQDERALRDWMTAEIERFETARGGKFLSLDANTRQLEELYKALRKQVGEVKPAPPPAPEPVVPAQVPWTITRGLPNVGNSCFINALVSATVAAQGVDAMLPMVDGQINQLTDTVDALEEIKGADLLTSLENGPNGVLKALRVEDFEKKSIAGKLAINHPTVQEALTQKIERCRSKYQAPISNLATQLQALDQSQARMDYPLIKRQVFDLERIQAWRDGGLLDANPPATEDALRAENALLDRIVDRIHANLTPASGHAYGRDLQKDYPSAVAVALFALPKVAKSLEISDPTDPWGTLKEPGIAYWLSKFEQTSWRGVDSGGIAQLTSVIRAEADERLNKSTLAHAFLSEFKKVLEHVKDPHRPKLQEQDMRPLANLAWRLMGREQGEQDSPAVLMQSLMNHGVSLLDDVVSTAAFGFDLGKVDSSFVNGNNSGLVQIKPGEMPEEPPVDLSTMCRAVGLGIKKPEEFQPGRLVAFDFSNFALQSLPDPNKRSDSIPIKRIFAEFNLDQNLRLESPDGRAVTFRPVSSTIHIGNSLDHGHYASLVNAAPNLAPPQWQWHNDSRVRSIDQPKVGGPSNRDLGVRPFPTMVFMRVVDCT